jgi:hypothetical protein
MSEDKSNIERHESLSDPETIIGRYTYEEHDFNPGLMKSLTGTLGMMQTILSGATLVLSAVDKAFGNTDSK